MPPGRGASGCTPGAKSGPELTFARPSWAALTPIDPGARRVIADGCRILHDPDEALTRLHLAVNGAR